MATDRVALLADCAIDLIAEGGMRALTHRAVDARAGLAQGSTSARFRSREALIVAVVERLAERDRADQAAHQLSVETAAPGEDTATTVDFDAFAVGIADTLDFWLTGGRNRALARYACLLEATHRPQLRAVLEQGTSFREQAAVILAAGGAPEPDRAASHVVAAIDGLLFDRLAGTGSLTAPDPGTEASRADLRRGVATILRAFTMDTNGR